MGWRFRKSFRIFPGIRLNLGKSGFTSISVGGKGLTTNISKRGVKHTIGAPGTGLSYQTPTYPYSSRYSDNYAPPPPLYRYCPRCSTAIHPDSVFCYKCGGAVPPNKQNLRRLNDRKNLFLIFAGLIVLLTLFVGIVMFFAAAPSRQTASLESAYQWDAPATRTPLDNSTSAASGIPTISSTGNRRAVVIARNAKLRKTPDAKGEVVQAISQATFVEVIRQEGSWFLVKGEGQTGWLHGNAIQLDNSSHAVSSVKPAPETVSNSYGTSPYSPYSGKSSLSDGSKPVHVEGYYRKNGTYVQSYNRRSPR